MDMCKPQPEHLKLKRLAGTWTGEETLHPSPWDPKGGNASGRIEARVELDGFYVVSDYVQERGGKPSYRGHGVFGWDSSRKCYTMHWFDSMGFPCSEAARGAWEGNRLVFEQSTPMGQARYSYDFEGDGRYGFRIENSPDGKSWTTFMEGRYTRK